MDQFLIEKLTFPERKKKKIKSSLGIRLLINSSKKKKNKKKFFFCAVKSTRNATRKVD